MVDLKKEYKKILVIPDVHLPWANWDAIQQAYKWQLMHKPDLVICLGDITDQKIWSRYPKDVDDFSPTEEFRRAEEGMKKMYKLFPKMIILRGNHDMRILAKAVEAGIPEKMFQDVHQIFNYKGWHWVNPSEKLIIKTVRGPILFVHGDEQGGTVAQKSRILGMNVCQGHTHKVSVTYTSSLKRHFWGAEFGCIMDTNSKAAKYAAANPVGTTVGFGVIKYGIPYFIDFIKGGKV
jgi:predicted phosphodiesterase